MQKLIIHFLFSSINNLASIRLEYNDENGLSFIKNVDSETTPSIVHGNGPSKTILNNYGTYLAGNWAHGKCLICEDNLMKTDDVMI